MMDDKIHGMNQHHNPYPERILRSVRHAVIIGALLFALSAFAVAQPDLNTWIRDSRLQEWGPYQLALTSVLAVIVTTVGSKLIKIAPKAFEDPVPNVVDEVLLSVTMWAINWILFWRIPGIRRFPDVNWMDFSFVVWMGRIVSWSCFVYLLFRVVYIWNNRLDSKDKQFSFSLFQDEPITYERHDLLRRQPIVQGLANAIYNFDRNGSLVVALTGPWGEGKTSVINLLIRRIEKGNESDSEGIAIVEFTPWYFSTGNDGNFDLILENFFKALDDEIQSVKIRPDISSLIRKYYKVISPAVESKSLIDLAPLFRKRTGVLDQMRDQLNRVLSELNIKFVVIIDDLDRMTGEEIAFVFKLVRLCADFDSLVYLLSFDRDFVNKQIGRKIDPSADEDKMVRRGREYVDKIVNWDFALPKIDRAVLYERVFTSSLNRIEKILQAKHAQDILLLNDTEFSERLEHARDHIIRVLDNIRLIKLFLNRYLKVIPQLVGEVNYFDLLLIELIRFRFPNLYETMYDRSDSFLVNIYPSIINDLYQNNEDREKREDFFNTFVSRAEEEYQDVLRYLLVALFPNILPLWGSFASSPTLLDIPRRSSFANKSISHQYYFPRYFRYSVQEGAFSDLEWQELIDKINSSTKSHLEEIIDLSVTESIENGKTIEDWLQRMRISFESGEIEEHRAHELMFLYIRNSKYWLDRSKDKRIYSLLAYSIIELAKLSSSTMEEMLPEAVREAPDVELLRYLSAHIEELSPENSGVRLKDKLKSLVAERLRQDYLVENQDIFKSNESFYGIYALKAFLDPSEYRSYIHKMVERNPKNAVRILRTLTNGAGLNFSTLSQIIEPEFVVNKIRESSLLTPDTEWWIKAIELGLRKQQENTRFTYVDQDLDLRN